MATATYHKGLAGQTGAATKPKGDFFGRLFKSLIASREREARRRVAIYMSTISDDRLKDLGLTVDEITKLRVGR